MRRALPFLIVLITAAPAQAQGLDRHTRSSATQALERAQRLAEGRGVRTGRELSAALQQVAAQRSDLSSAQREQADRLLARPTDPTDDGPGGPYSPSATVVTDCTDAHFCLHWVETTNDAPPLADTDPAPNGRPDYIDDMIASFQRSFDVENTQLGWIAPVPDGSLGGNAKTDVYVKDIGDDNIYGYASTDPGQTGRSRFAYLVMDDDYAPDEFPGYTDPLQPMQVTAAHEYNHVLQYAYDAFQDTWMFESTATWSEEKVFDDVNDYVFYLDSWAEEPDEPITSPGDDPLANSDDLKMYGSAIWNHWLEGLYGPEAVRRAWAISQANSVAGGGFAPRAYDQAIRQEGGPGFATELAIFSAATAEWDAANSGIREGASFPAEVLRAGTLTTGGAAATGVLDHTAFALYYVSMPTGGGDLHLTGGLPAGTAGAIALVAFDGTNQTRVVGQLDADGRVTVTLPDPGRFSRITAVVVNSDTRNAGFSSATNDWIWTRDNQLFSLSATAGAPPSESTPTPTASPTATPIVTPTPTPAPDTSVRLTRNTTRIASAARKGVLSLFARTNKAGRLTARATVDTATAKRLKVGRRTTTVGTGRRTATAPARVKINVMLTRKARAALRRQTKRTLRIKVQVTFVPADGTRAVRRTLSILLRP